MGGINHFITECPENTVQPSNFREQGKWNFNHNNRGYWSQNRPNFCHRNKASLGKEQIDINFFPLSFEIKDTVDGTVKFILHSRAINNLVRSSMDRHMLDIYDIDPITLKVNDGKETR